MAPARHLLCIGIETTAEDAMRRPRLTAIPADLVSLDDYARLADDHIDAPVRAHIEGGSGAEQTLAANRAAFGITHIYNRLLADMRRGSTATRLLGTELHHPILLAPVAYQKLVHPEGEVATARGALDTLMVASTLASATLEEIAAASAGPLWFQLYMQPRREDTLALVRRAEAAGYRAIMVTLDTTVQTPPRAAQRLGFHLPGDVRAENLRDQAPLPPVALPPDASIVFQGAMADAPRAEDLGWLLSETRLPVIAKGVLHPADAEMLRSMGVAGIVVSNHGGRGLDGAPASLAALPAIRAALGRDYPVLLDGGIRSGTDAFKALARGADAVMIGRPQLHALAVAGSLGVAHMTRMIRQELEIAMALAGRATIADIDDTALFPC